MKAKGVAEHLNGSHAHEARVVTPRREAVEYSKTVAQRATVTTLVELLDPMEIWLDVMTFGNLMERYCTTDSGEHAQEWLQMQVLRAAYRINATVGSVYGGSVHQSSIIARVPGRSNRTTVIDAHLDSVAGDLSGYEDWWDKTYAPGADENAPASVTILEAFRTLSMNKTIATGGVPNTIELY